MSKADLSARSFTRNTSGKAWVGRVVNYFLLQWIPINISLLKYYMIANKNLINVKW